LAGGEHRWGWSLPAAALTTLMLLELLRVWLPSVLFVVGDAAETPPALMGAFAIACLATGALSTIRRLPATALWWGGVGAVVVARLVVQATDGGTPQAVSSSIGVVGASIALAALAAAAPSGHAARTGVLAGLAAGVAVHAALGTRALVWSDGAGPWVAVGLVAASLVVAAVAVVAEEGWGGEGDAAGPAWPWLTITSALVLIGIVSGVPSRATMATGWQPGPVAALITVCHGLAVTVALTASRLPTGLTGAGGAALVLVGTAIALRPTSPLALAAQLLIVVGIGAVLAATSTCPGRADPGRRAAAAAGGVVLFGVVVFLYYGSYDMVLPFPNRAILLTVAALTALTGLVAGYIGRQPRPPGPGWTPTLAALSAVLALSGLVWAAVPATGSAPPAVGQDDERITVALYNVHMGYDVHGRLAVDAQAEILARLDPDVVVLNEVDRGWLITGGHDTLRLLSERLGLPFVFAPAADEVWGNALLSRFPVSELTVQRLPQGGAPMARSHLAAVLRVSAEREIAVVGTHLSHLDLRGDTRLPQARAVAATVARLRERGLPTVVLGDLNAEPGSPELETFGSLVTSAVPPANPTWPSWDPVEQIDHVLVSDEIVVTATGLPSSTASDHLPVFAVIDPTGP